jgi:hypothetical protein
MLLQSRSSKTSSAGVKREETSSAGVQRQENKFCWSTEAGKTGSACLQRLEKPVLLERKDKKTSSASLQRQESQFCWRAKAGKLLLTSCRASYRL